MRTSPVPTGHFGGDQLGYFQGDALVGKTIVEGGYVVLQFGGRRVALLEAGPVNLLQHSGPAFVVEKLDHGLEGDEVPQLRHVDSVAIGVADLRGGGGDEDARGFQAGEHLDDGSLQSRSADDGVVQTDECFPFPDRTVADVVHMGDHFPPALFLADECPQLDVLVCDFLRPGPVRHDQVVQALLVERAFPHSLENGLLHLVAAVSAQSLHKPVVGNLGGFGM